MPPSSTLTDSSSLPHLLSPTSDRRTPGFDGPEDQADAGVWKRRYLALQESVNAESAPKSSKRKTE
jgi:hypothetical protein